MLFELLVPLLYEMLNSRTDPSKQHNTLLLSHSLTNPLLFSTRHGRYASCGCVHLTGAQWRKELQCATQQALRQ